MSAKIKKMILMSVLGILFTYFIIQATPAGDRIVISPNDCRITHGSLNDDEKLLMISENERVQECFVTCPMFLKKGNYTAEIFYDADGDGNAVYFSTNGVHAKKYELDKDLHTISIPIAISKDSQDSVIEFDYSGTGSLSIGDVIVTCDGWFYNDVLLIVILLWIVLCLLYELSIRNWSDQGRKRLLICMTIIGIAFISFIPYVGGAMRT